MEVQLLHTGNGITVLGCRAERPGPEGANHARFNPIAQRMQNRQVGDFTAGIDGHIHHHIPLNAMGQDRQIGRRAGGVRRERDLDRARTPGVGTAIGIRDSRRRRRSSNDPARGTSRRRK